MALITHTLAACTSSQSSVTASSTINTRASSVPPQPLIDGSETHVSGTDTIMHPPAAEPISTVESATVPPLSVNTHMHTPHKELAHAFLSSRSRCSWGTHLIGSHFGTASKLPLTPIPHPEAELFEGPATWWGDHWASSD